MMTIQARRAGYYIAAIAILALALTLRLYGHNWDDGQYLHPDERFIISVLVDRIHFPNLENVGTLLEPGHSPLNVRAIGQDWTPSSFAYGSLPLYVTGFVAWVLGSLTGQDLKTYAHVVSIGRYLTALLDVGTVLLAMLFAKRAFGSLAALLTGLLLATTVLTIQLAHFFTTDSWITFFAMAALYCALRIRDDDGLRWPVLAGAALGAAFATKVSIVTLILPIAVAIVTSHRAQSSQPLIRRPLMRAITTLGAVALVFAIFEPYALWEPRPFLHDIVAQWEIISGRLDIPYTRQFAGTVPVVYQLDNLIRWGIGPVLGLAALASVVLAVRRNWRRPSSAEFLLLAWIIPYFLLISSAEAKFLRYTAPIIPALVIVTGSFLARHLSPTSARGLPRLLMIGAAAVVIAGTVIWAAAFASIYSRPHTRVAASDWIQEHVPAGSTITSEYWDDQLPLPLYAPPGQDQYRHLSLDLYADRDNEQAISHVNDFLQQADYIVLSSDRLAESIPRLPWRYPVISRYYTLLESGQLGFQLVYESDDALHLGPFRINDRSADESFTVNDHPHVRIYKKVVPLTSDELRQRFAWALDQPWSPSRSPGEAKLLSGAPADQLPVAGDLGWSASATAPAPVAILAWLLVLAALAAVTVPVTLLLFRGFGDLGWGFARLAGLIVSGYAVWIAVSLGVARFSLEWIVGIAALVALVVWVALRGKLKALVAEARAHWRMMLVSEAVFLAAFGVFLFLRALNPDLWQAALGGEKPMEMAFISAIGRSATFPPYDPWYAGGIINYYYYGFYLIALLWKLSGVPPEIGFQLGIATVSAALVSGLFSLASTLTADFLSTRRLAWMITGGLTGVVLHTVIGNLDAARQILALGTTAIDFWQSSRVVDGAITEFPYFTQIWADLHPHAIALPIAVLLVALAYTRLRSMPGEVPARFWVPAVGLLLGTLLVVNAWDMPLAAILIGAVILTRALRQQSSFPTYARAGLAWSAALAIAGLLFLPFLSHYVPMVNGVGLTSGGTTWNEYLIHFGIFLGILVAAGTAWIGRRSIFSRLPVGLLSVSGAVSALAGFTVANLFLTPPHTDLMTLALTGTLVIVLAAAFPPIAYCVLIDHRRRLILSAASITLMAVVGLLAPYRLTASLLLIPLLLGILLWLHFPRRPPVAFVGLCLAAAAGVTLGTDLVYVIDDLQGSIWERMNTVFKFYLQGWTFYTLAATVALVWLLKRATLETTSDRLHFVAQSLQSRDTPGAATTVGGGRYPLAPVALSVALLLVIVGLAYPVFGTPQRLAQRMPGSPAGLSLDGLAWMRESTITNTLGERIDFSGDYDAIVWLRGHADGNPVILEASIGPYRGNGARISAATGLPAVLGWDRHERQQRYALGIDQRLRDILEIYRTPSVERKRLLLRTYDVRYIVVGDVERRWTIEPPFAGVTDPYERYASAEGLAAFDRMLGTDLRVAFRSGQTTVYEVIPFPSLPPDVAAGASS
jgi:YYY domain-containing protein